MLGKLKTTLLCALAATALLHAEYDQPGSYSVGAEFLYFQPLVDNTYFVIKDPNGNAIDGHRSGNKFEWEPGFRVQANYTFCGGINDAEFRYTRVKATRVRDIVQGITSGASLLPTTGYSLDGLTSFFGSAHSHIELRYQAIDALLGQLMYEGCGFEFAVKGGLHWADFHNDQHIAYNSILTTTTTTDLAFHNRIWGVGPELAFDVVYELPQEVTFCLPLSLVGSSRAALLVSKDRASFGQSLVGVNIINVHNEDMWRIIPMWDLRFGIAYAPDFGCGFNTHFELGYEVLTYHRAAHNIRFEGNNGEAANGWSFDEFSDVGFHGLYVAVNVGF